MALVDGALVEDFAVRVLGGAIVAAGNRSGVAVPGDDVLDLGERLMLPGTINAHNHSFQSLLRGFGDDLDFLSWRERALYRYSPEILRAPDGVYTGALLAFAEMALHGVTTVCDFFYLNDGGNRSSGRRSIWGCASSSRAASTTGTGRRRRIARRRARRRSGSRRCAGGMRGTRRSTCTRRRIRCTGRRRG
jgi:cytosine/adenosine deaminase-related metal-dependent hydrolase